MSKSLFKLFIFALLITSVFKSYAWWGIGHMVIANIAYQNLNDKAKNKVDHLLTEFKKATPTVNSFEQLAAWPDTLYWKQKIMLTFNWHFIDTPFSADQTQAKKTHHGDNAIWAINKIINAFNDQSASDYEQSRMLAFLIHIVGDLHQPLHNISRITAAHPDGDEGGNKFVITYKGEKVKLHQVWDNCFDELTDDETLSNAKRISRQITASYPISYFGSRINNLNPTSWSKEGFDNSIQYVYDTPEDETPSAHYINHSKQLIKEEIALAGYRLAGLLNELFGN